MIALIHPKDSWVARWQQTGKVHIKIKKQRQSPLFTGGQ
jgi:hypothetical protein